MLAGSLNTGSTLALYRSFEVGKMSIVAPLSASYPVLTLLLSVVTGERLTSVRLAGIVLTIIGVVLVAGGEKIPSNANPLEGESHPGKKRLGVGWALLSAIGFGIMFWLLGIRVVPVLGAAASVWAIRATSVFVTVLVVFLARHSLARPSQREAPGIFAIGLLDTSAYLFNNYGMQREQTSVVSVLASLYGAVTVVLAGVLWREHISRLQYLGITAIFTGVLLISR
jgi:drug/metabolite transporter (DMT)-like permease